MSININAWWLNLIHEMRMNSRISFFFLLYYNINKWKQNKKINQKEKKKKLSKYSFDFVYNLNENLILSVSSMPHWKYSLLGSWSVLSSSKFGVEKKKKIIKRDHVWL